MDTIDLIFLAILVALVFLAIAVVFSSSFSLLFTGRAFLF